MKQADVLVEARFQSSFEFEKDRRVLFLLNEFPNFQAKTSSLGILIHEKLSGNSIFKKLLRSLLEIVAPPRLPRGFVKYIFEWSSPTFAERVHIKLRALSVISLPHGFNIYVNSDFEKELRKRREEVAALTPFPNFKARISFQQYVVQTPHLQDLMVLWGLPREKIPILGSPRFTRDWLKQLESIWPAESQERSTREWKDGHRKHVVFLLPHWTYNVKRESVLYFLQSLKNERIPVLVRSHSRGTGDLEPDEVTALSSEFFHYDQQSPSTRLILESAVTVSFGTSVALDSILWGTPLVNAKWLHTNETIFDEMQGVVQANTAEQALAVIKGLMRGEALNPPIAGPESTLLSNFESSANKYVSLITEQSYSNKLGVAGL